MVVSFTTPYDIIATSSYDVVPPGISEKPINIGAPYDAIISTTTTNLLAEITTDNVIIPQSANNRPTKTGIYDSQNQRISRIRQRYCIYAYVRTDNSYISSV